MSEPKLAVTALSKRFGDLEVLRDINVAIARGEFISLVGPSGCGKTTLAAHRRRARSGERRRGPARRPRGARARHRPRLRVPERQPAAVAHACSPMPCIGPEIAGRTGAAEQAPHARPAAARRPRRFRALFSAPALGRHAPARQPRPRARDRPGNPADGRAVLGARRPDPRDHADRADAHLGGGPQDRAVRHPPDRRGGVPVRPRAACWRGARAASRKSSRSPCRGRARSRSSAPRNSSPMSTASGA